MRFAAILAFVALAAPAPASAFSWWQVRHPVKAAERALVPGHRHHHHHRRHHVRWRMEAGCAMQHVAYTLRHGVNKPRSLRGLHGCRLYAADARYHSRRPTARSVVF